MEDVKTKTLPSTEKGIAQNLKELPRDKAKETVPTYSKITRLFDEKEETPLYWR